MTSVQPLRKYCSRSLSAGLVVLAAGACHNDSTEPARLFEGGCDDRVEEDLAADRETEAVTVGPLLFAYLRTLYLDPTSVPQIPTQLAVIRRSMFSPARAVLLGWLASHRNALLA